MGVSNHTSPRTQWTLKPCSMSPQCEATEKQQRSKEKQREAKRSKEKQLESKDIINSTATRLMQIADKFSNDANPHWRFRERPISTQAPCPKNPVKRIWERLTCEYCSALRSNGVSSHVSGYCVKSIQLTISQKVTLLVKRWHGMSRIDDGS